MDITHIQLSITHIRHPHPNIVLWRKPWFPEKIERFTQNLTNWTRRHYFATSANCISFKFYRHLRQITCPYFKKCLLVGKNKPFFNFNSTHSNLNILGNENTLWTQKLHILVSKIAPCWQPWNRKREIYWLCWILLIWVVGMKWKCFQIFTCFM